MIFTVTLDNGQTTTVNGACSVEDALIKGEAKFNCPYYLPPSQASIVLAENKSLRLGDDGKIHKVNPAVAVSAVRMREIYVNGGYCIIPHEEQKDSLAQAV